MNEFNRIIQGDVIEILRSLPDEFVHCVITSPPYYGLRDYGVPGQIGLEKTMEEYVAKMVEVFHEVRRVLRNDGTLWLNLGDSYFHVLQDERPAGDGIGGTSLAYAKNQRRCGGKKHHILKPKDLCGIPWRVAFALQADGWYLRSDIIWAKPNPMPESVIDRPTKAHEYIFLMAKSKKYFYDAEAIKEPISYTYKKDKRPHGVLRQRFYPDSKYVKNGMIMVSTGDFPRESRALTRNKRSVWTINTHSFPEAHFATFPEKLIEPCIKAGTSEKGCCEKCKSPMKRVLEKKSSTMSIRVRDNKKGIMEKKSGFGGKYKASESEIQNYGKELEGTSKTIGWKPSCSCGAETVPCIVLDPFMGAGTTGLVSAKLGRKYLGIELKPEYIKMAERRIHNEYGLMGRMA